ncbi:hypothetical protein A3781_04590 [Bacillus badius]|nr:hypothetical protein A3781_04590 [Bacillus badius]
MRYDANELLVRCKSLRPQENASEGLVSASGECANELTGSSFGEPLKTGSRGSLKEYLGREVFLTSHSGIYRNYYFIDCPVSQLVKGYLKRKPAPRVTLQKKHL